MTYDGSDIRKVILDTVSDLVSDFLYYERKEDEFLPRGAIEQAIADKTITVDEIVETFKTQLKAGLGIK